MRHLQAHVDVFSIKKYLCCPSPFYPSSNYHDDYYDLSFVVKLLITII
jgi:hypothetical protein